MIDRERKLVELAYERGFWDGVAIAQAAEVTLPQDWIERDVADTFKNALRIVDLVAPAEQEHR